MSKLKEYTEHYDNGQLLRKYYTKNDELEGEYSSYHYNGQLFEKCYYKNDELEGEYLSYYNNGQLWEKRYYKNGIQVEYDPISEAMMGLL